MKKLKHLRKISIFMLLLFIGCIITVHAQNGWEQMKSMKVAKGGSQSCVIDNTIYVLGGCDNAIKVLNSAEAYNTETNEWCDVKSIPVKVYESNAEAINNIIYVVGGWTISANASWIAIDSSFAYDPVSDSWKTITNFPLHSGANSSCVLDDKLYIIGGLKNFADVDNSGQKQAFVYDPIKDTWASLPPMKYERGEGSTASAFDNKIYVFGGLHAISEKTQEFFIVGKTEMYDPVLNKWTELANMPIPVVNHISVVHNNKIYLFGGDIGTFKTWQSFGSNIIQEYDPSIDKWTIMEGMPFNLGNMTGQKAGNYVYIIGGYPSSRMAKQPKSEVWRFNLDYLIAR